MQTVTSYPWSLRKMFVFFLCFILPPIGAIYILRNREALQKRDFILYVLFAAINISLWLSECLDGSRALCTWSNCYCFFEYE